jgi:hypothetical protein
MQALQVEIIVLKSYNWLRLQSSVGAKTQIVWHVAYLISNFNFRSKKNVYIL